MKLQTSEDGWWLRLSRPVRALPADVLGLFGVTVLAALLVSLPASDRTAVRFLVGVVLLFFLPGYAIVAALFPGRVYADESRYSPSGGWIGSFSSYGSGIGMPERLALSVASSIVTLVLVGLALSPTPWGLALEPFLAVLVGIVAVGGAVATIRRRRLPPEYRFRVPFRAWLGRTRERIFGADSRSEVVVNVLLAGAIIVATSSLAFALAAPGDGEAYTDFYLVTQNEDTGELVAANYPSNFTRGEAQPLTVGVENHEDRPFRYTVVVELQRVRTDGGEVTVLEESELTRMDHSLSAGETWTKTHDVLPTIAGENLRLTYLLYRDDVPAHPSTTNAYRSLHLWVNVSNVDA